MTDEYCSVHGGTATETFCDPGIIFCTKWDGTFDENEYPNCRYPELEEAPSGV